MVTDFGTNRKPIFDFLFLILTYLLSCTVSKLLLIIGQIFASVRGPLHLNVSLGAIPCECAINDIPLYRFFGLPFPYRRSPILVPIESPCATSY